MRWSTIGATFFFSLSALANDWPYLTAATAPFRPPQLEVSKTGTTDPGYLFIGPRGNEQSGTAALIYDEDGNLVYQGPEEVTANFKVQRLFNQDVITFWAGDMTKLGYGYGTVHILDNSYREIYTVRLQDDIVTPDGQPRESYIDLHESHITKQNTLLVTAYNVTPHDLTSIGGNPDMFMLDAMFYELDIATNEIIHSWNALDHLDKIPLEQSKQGLGADFGVKENPWDAYHINAVERMDEGYMISLRHYWSGYYVHNNGSIMWQLSGALGEGDFKQDESAGFSWQHDIRIYNHTEQGLVMDLFNNANTPTEQQGATTGVSLAVDLENRSVKALRILSDSDDVIHSVSQGSYQLMSEESQHVFMGYGSISKVKEFDANNNAVFTAQFGVDNEVASYRGYKCPWKATPFWKPAAVVQRPSSDVADVFMSWNGATEYDNWAVMSLPSPDSTDSEVIATQQRTGFETVAHLTGVKSGGYMQVVARRGDVPLGTSEVVSV
ncbi:arylsulfotransferase family protein [Aspergillus glaucus CBS 516.65]|uniref:ASST-domain-containing protein n=1 Tax=Aspergillus glaucus CBS 516.65 TaxID=1160497 RepID=A0A1L9VPU4_ASPGL|nr:hypothetical protein ASPGLDRAFT_44872 [Aspergillus glaucus CBS 516.65]OJJ85900.1 hypothetical protein ASPGLDRAFT_44872 [Aspergillus glaucus CBS 516.65]